MNTEELQLIKHSILFDGLNEAVANDILQQCHDQKAPSGFLLFSAGETAQHVYFILDGVIQLFRGTNEGKHAVLGLRGKGDVVGLAATFSGHFHYSTAKTVRKCKTLSIPVQALKEIRQKSPTIGDRLARKVTDNLLGISQHLERLQLLQTTQRLADYLLNSAKPLTPSCELTLPCDKGLIASYLGMERESFSRALAKLRQVGVITKGRHIQITDTPALIALRDQPT